MRTGRVLAIVVAMGLLLAPLPWAHFGTMAQTGCPILLTPCSVTSVIDSNFNGTPIAAGNYIWFNSVFKVQGLGTTPVTVAVLRQTVTSDAFTITVPPAVITFDPNLTTATTIFEGMEWVTQARPGLPGNTFLSGAAYQVPNNLPGGLNPVTWQASFVTDTPGITVQWQWAAAVYTSFSTDLNALGVKPVDDNKASIYQNSDHAGTPENFTSFVIGGPRGGGGSNFTGSLSASGSVS